MMSHAITHPDAAWKQASTMFKRKSDSNLTVFTVNSLSEQLAKLLTSIGIAVAIVMPLGDKDTVIKECKTSSYPPEYQTYFPHIPLTA